MMPQNLKSVDFTKTQSKYLENKKLFFLQIKKLIIYIFVSYDYKYLNKEIFKDTLHISNDNVIVDLPQLIYKC